MKQAAFSGPTHVQFSVPCLCGRLSVPAPEVLRRRLQETEGLGCSVRMGLETDVLNLCTLKPSFHLLREEADTGFIFIAELILNLKRIQTRELCLKKGEGLAVPVLPTCHHFNLWHLSFSRSPPPFIFYFEKYRIREMQWWKELKKSSDPAFTCCRK